jgi:pimeloyl-ACP methyl ester carboxylesterase
MNQQNKTNVLIHGLWVTPRSWESFQGFYEAQGYRVFAPAWPRLHGEVEDIADPSALAGLGLLEIFEHYAKFFRTLDEPPILIGHS